MEGVLPYRIHMMGRLLLRRHDVVEFRQKYPRNAQFICIPNELRAVGHQQLHKLRLDPLRTDLLERRCKHPHRFFCLPIDLKSKLCRETDAS